MLHEAHGALQPPDQHRERIERYFDPLPFWDAPMQDSMIQAGEFPLHALTQRPMHMYHSRRTQNSWLRQITNRNCLYMNLNTAKRYGLVGGDWAWVSSHHGRIRVQIGLMDGVNKNTVWTWNAIGKRSGAWNLKPGGPEAEKGFLLNHLISELLPDNGTIHQYANADPITGQGAWFDLRVHIEKAGDEEPETSAPEFDDLVLKIVERKV